MSRDKTLFAGAIKGFALAGLPGTAAAVLLDLHDGLFLDVPFTWWLLFVAGPGLLGALLGAALRGHAAKWPGGLAVTSAAIVFGLSVGGPPVVPELELLVVGIDGAAWEHADPMFANGELPGLQRVRAEGATGTMKAPEPLFSPVLWTTMAAGKGWEEHEVRGFRVHSDNSRVPRFFDIAEDQGKRIGLYKWLVTWPPRDLEHGGFIVPAWLAPTPETNPEELSFVKELELSRRLKRHKAEAVRPSWLLALEGLRHGFRASTLLHAARWTLTDRVMRPPEETRELELNLLRGEMDRDVFVWAVLNQRPALATFTYYPTDALGHVLWKYHEPDAFNEVDPAKVAMYGEGVRDAYRQADAILVELWSMLPEGGRLVVVSDHGFQALDAAKLGDLAVPRTDRLEQRVKAEVGPVQVARVGTKITLVPECPSDGPVDCGPRTHAAIIEWLDTLVRSDTGKPLYILDPFHEDPSTVAIKLAEERLDPGVADTATVSGEPLSKWVGINDKYSGDHTAYGIFGAWGPGVTPGATANVDILDVAPAVLAGLGIGPGADMPGRVPEAIWDAPQGPGSWDAVRKKLHFPGEQATEQDVNTEMLQALGYLDDGYAPAPAPKQEVERDVNTEMLQQLGYLDAEE